MALEGRGDRASPFSLLKQLMDHLRFTEERMDDVEKEIARRMEPYRDDVDRLCTIPGVERVTAWGLLAEIGFQHGSVSSAVHLASWAGLCPGNFESAGKRLSGRTRKGSAALRAMLITGRVRAVSTKKNNYLAAFYRRGAARRGAKRAIIAVAHQLLVIAFYLLKRKEQYRELGANHFDNINADRVRHSLVKRLERLGHIVTLQPAVQSA